MMAEERKLYIRISSGYLVIRDTWLYGFGGRVIWEGLSSIEESYLGRLDPSRYRSIYRIGDKWPATRGGNLSGYLLKGGGKLYIRGESTILGGN